GQQRDHHLAQRLVRHLDGARDVRAQALAELGYRLGADLRCRHYSVSSGRVRSRTAAAGSGERISVSPISTASTPTRSSSSISARERMPDSDTTILPVGI